MRLNWDAVGEKKYEMGTDRGVLYPMDSKGDYSKGFVWNGLTAVTESPGGAEPTDMYADNIKYASMVSAETFSFTIESYAYPDEFEECDGSKEVAKGVTIGQQSRNMFGFSYRTLIGNDTATEDDDGYKLHLVYGCRASVSEKGYTTVSDSPEAITFSWEVTTTPITIPGMKATATIVIDSTKCDPEKLKMLEDILYGTDDSTSISTLVDNAEGDGSIDDIEDDDAVDTPQTPAFPTIGTTARLPMPSEVIELFKDDSVVA